MNEFYIHAFSNADTKRHQNNTLTSFVNNLPVSLDLPYYEKWHVCVQSVGFSSKFPSVVLPKDESLPCMKIFSKNTEPSIKYEHEVDIFFPSKFSDIKTIKKSFEVIAEKNLGLEFVFNEDENIKILYSNKNHKKYKLEIHEAIVSSFGLSRINTKIKYINNILYYIFTISSENPIIQSYLKRWNFKHPDLVRIQCDQIAEQMFNSKLTKDLKIFCPSFENKEKYTIHQFDSEEYAPISNSVLDKLSIKILNENNENIELDYGVSTFVKLKFKKMNLHPDNFNVRLSPNDHQSFNSFVIDLPQPYYLDCDWKVSLSSINYANIFRPLPFEEPYRTIWTASLGTNLKKKNEEDLLKSHIMPNVMYSNSGLINELNKILSNRTKERLSIEKLLRSDTSIKGLPLGQFKTEEFEEYGEKKIKVSITVNEQSYILIPISICELLGFNPTIDTSDNVIISPSGYSVCFLNTFSDPITINFSGFFHLNRLRPEYLMVYTDIIEQTIVGNSFSKLIKIVPVYHESTDSYKTLEFKNKEFHSLENTLVKRIKFEIRSHSGDLINFMEGSKIFINLLFSK